MSEHIPVVNKMIMTREEIQDMVNAARLAAKDGETVRARVMAKWAEEAAELGGLKITEEGKVVQPNEVA